MISADFLDQVQHHTSELMLLAFDEKVDRQGPVPSCPGWSIDDLFAHLWAIETWVTGVIRTREPAAEVDPSGRSARDFVDDLPTFLTVLRHADPEQPCWSFGSDRTVGFWHRRQAHEHAIHHWDLANAVGRSIEFDPEFAADGVSEVVEMFYPRQVRKGRTQPLPDAVQLVAADTGDEWTLGDGAPRTTVAANASELYLGLWNRQPLVVDGAAIFDGVRVTP
ncbi:MAG: maleylpyruvate isomerase family mycothiol-dependent enzyme [Nocardiaceae bacterium]|nr:maleylpyruvate isomerase family mycothiol-dependent enzyme [Nocardiaceae bacterium]